MVVARDGYLMKNRKQCEMNLTSQTFAFIKSHKVHEAINHEAITPDVMCFLLCSREILLSWCVMRHAVEWSPDFKLSLTPFLLKEKLYSRQRDCVVNGSYFNDEIMEI